MLTSPKFLFYLTCLLLGKMAQMNNFTQSTIFHQDTGFISANVGENLTLKCFYGGDGAKYYWYKQILGQKPELIAVTLNRGKIATLQNGFDKSRFKLETNVSVNHLKISHLQLSDSATYYCGRGDSLKFEFTEGKTVSIKDLEFNIHASVHQLPDTSVTLNCTVHTGTCDGERSVYWFKNSKESSSVLIYSNGGRYGQCEKKADRDTDTCVYNLQMKNPNLADAGTYYCAVASCGHILFGNGTTLEFKDDMESLVMVYFLSGALTFTSILCILLAFIMYKMSKGNNCQFSESHGTPSTTNAEGSQQGDIHYAALNVILPNKSRRQRDKTMTECVYSGVRQ